MSQQYTFDELMQWKSRSEDPREQRKIRRLIRQLRAKDPDTPTMTRNVSARTGHVQTVSDSEFDPADQRTWPRDSLGRPLGGEHWTEHMHLAYIDWTAKHKPLHAPAFINGAGVPQYGCSCSRCSTVNFRIYDMLVAGDVPSLEEYNLERAAAGLPVIDIGVLKGTVPKKKSKKEKKLKKAHRE